jgi:hypothetical protein
MKDPKLDAAENLVLAFSVHSAHCQRLPLGHSSTASTSGNIVEGCSEQWTRSLENKWSLRVMALHNAKIAGYVSCHACNVFGKAEC